MRPACKGNLGRAWVFGALFAGLCVAGCSGGQSDLGQKSLAVACELDLHIAVGGRDAAPGVVEVRQVRREADFREAWLAWRNAQQPP